MINYFNTSYSAYISKLYHVSDLLRVTLNGIVAQHIMLCECLEKVLNYIALMCDDRTVHLACKKQWGLVWNKTVKVRRKFLSF